MGREGQTRAAGFSAGACCELPWENNPLLLLLLLLAAPAVVAAPWYSAMLRKSSTIFLS
jgi:hypothetical protein